jgi:hypothetical protein
MSQEHGSVTVPDLYPDLMYPDPAHRQADKKHNF